MAETVTDCDGAALSGIGVAILSSANEVTEKKLRHIVSISEANRLVFIILF
ncbi:hypothetical protein VIC_001860 [Vibrio coralliilyticus ATCC BAA-450]|nr:hypothetical protein VIC_001860 [Vibrio coralliilyticus ATCC BAA-450]